MATTCQLLIGDIGGTNARLELWINRPEFGCNITAFHLVYKTVYSSCDFTGLAQLVRQFLKDADTETLINVNNPVHACCIAVCGPVFQEERSIYVILFGLDNMCLVYTYIHIYIYIYMCVCVCVFLLLSVLDYCNY